MKTTDPVAEPAREIVDADVADATAASPQQADPTQYLDGPELFQALAGIDRRLGESQRLLERQQGLADRLHAENQDLRAGELRSAQLPLVRDLLRLYDDIDRIRGAAGNDKDLGVVQSALADTLARNGAIAFEPDHGVEFDPRVHSVAAIEATTEEALNRTVASVVKQGFKWDSGEVIRVAEVTAYRFTAPS